MSMFDEQALAHLDPDERAYVQGHAVAVYLYGKTLPTFTGHKGYEYAPGISGPDARVPYVWADVMVARSGGVDGLGTIAAGEGDEPPCDGDDDVCTDDEETPPDDPDRDDDDDDPYIDEDCEEFLDPAAQEARALAPLVPVDDVLGYELAGYAEYQREFERGMAEALYLEDLDEDTDHSEVEHLKDDVQDYGMCEHSPLVLDLDGDGVSVSRVADGVDFDLRADGRAVRSAWPTGGDALLALDWDGDGAITSGAELFGNGAGTRDGFAALAALDASHLGGNGDGQIDASDALFGRLVLWTDSDRDGRSTTSELGTLASHGVVAIDLGHVGTAERDAHGNRHAQHGTFVRLADGDAHATTGTIVDVWFRYRRIAR